jgi:branched-chain amino acid transport system ATP-binding protein
VLEVKDLVSGYGDIMILHELSLHVEKGEIVGILGANGVGKTTLLNTISGLIKTRSGKIIYSGKEIQNIAPYKEIKLGITQVPQGRKIFGRMTVLENLQLSLDYAGGKLDEKTQLDYVLHLFPELKDRLNQFGGTLSGGEQQMLAIARALIVSPELILMDEPSMGLAPFVVEHVFQAIKKISDSGTTILLVEQNAVAALNIVERLYVMDMGHVVYESEQINERELDKIKSVYLGMNIS